jgi:hypothetical protein
MEMASLEYEEKGPKEQGFENPLSRHEFFMGEALAMVGLQPQFNPRFNLLT